MTCSWMEETGECEPLNLHTQHIDNFLSFLCHIRSLGDHELHNGVVGVVYVYFKVILSDKYFCSAEASLEAVSQTEAEEPAQTSDEASLPSTSQEPSSSSAGTRKHT